MKLVSFAILVSILFAAGSTRAEGRCAGGVKASATVEPAATIPLPAHRILRANEASIEGSFALSDLDARSAWLIPAQPDDVTATFSLPLEIGITRLAIVGLERGDALPTSITILTRENEFAASIEKKDRAAWIRFPGPVHTDCLTLRIHEAPPKKRAIAEVFVGTEFDGQSRADLVAQLSTPKGEEAAAFLKITNAETLPLLTSAFDTMSARGKSLAIDVAASVAECEQSAPLFVRAATSREADVAKKARDRVERCGKRSTKALVAALTSKEEDARAFGATMLALVAPNASAEELANALILGGSPATRRALRGALARSVRDLDSDRLGPLLFPAKTDARAELDLIRAGVGRLGDVGSEARRAVAKLAESPSAETRYLAVEPARALATPTSTTLLAAFAEDKDPHVRQRAMELSEATPFLIPLLAKGARDSEPRVRQAAFQSLSKIGWSEGTATYAAAMLRDPWTFVRVAAANAVARLPVDSNAEPVIADGLKSGSPPVKRALLEGIEESGERARAAMVESLLETRETLDIRERAVRVLGRLCAPSSVPVLTHAAGDANPRARDVVIAAIDSLGRLHPPDLESTLRDIASKNEAPEITAAIERARREPAACAK